MDLSSRKTIHMGVNCVLAPMPVLDSKFKLALLQELEQSQLVFARIEQKDSQIVLGRDNPTPLNVQISSGGPVGQVLIVSANPDGSLSAFSIECDLVVRAFELAAQTGPRQVVSKDATIRDLYESGGIHAFQEIWELFLKQPPDTLAMLGKEVLGGGLRFVMPPSPSEDDPVQIELKIESFLRDSRKVFIEAQFRWPRPSPPGGQLSPSELLQKIDEYIVKIAHDFAGGQK